jgi:hypothetical protein
MSNRILKGILKNTQNGWVINHDIIDPYGQIPHPIRLHPSDTENLIDGEEIQFEVVYEYYGKLKLKH